MRMPEIPELEAIAGVLNARAKGLRIVAVAVRIPVVIRRPSEQEFVEILTNGRFLETRRHGKYLLSALESGHVLAMNLMLTSRLHHVPAETRLPKRTSWTARFEDGQELRFSGLRLDGRVYLVPVGALSLVPRFDEMGPDVMDPALTFDEFRQRARRFPGQIKRTLTNAAFVAGIGNAYSDEILFEAGVYPFEATRKLPDEKLLAIFEAIPKVYGWAVPLVAEHMGERIEVKVRDHLRVHKKGGQPCPQCGSTIAEVAPNQRITSYCRTCQGWGEAKLRGSSVGVR